MRVILSLLASTIVLSACTGTQVKRHIAQDLSRIVDLQDCPTVCEQLQLYINTKLLGVSK